MRKKTRKMELDTFFDKISSTDNMYITKQSELLRIEFNDVPFVANNDGVIVEIPIQEWECIRQNTAVRNVYLDWTDEEILSESTKKIEDIYNEYNKTGIQSPVSLMRYGQFSRRTKEEIIQQEVAEITKKRDFERYIAGCVKKYLEGDGNE